MIIPSDYAISRFIDEDMLQPLNFDNIPNMKYIDEKYTHLDFDPEQKYSVPYTWGVVGIVTTRNTLIRPTPARGICCGTPNMRTAPRCSTTRAMRSALR